MKERILIKLSGEALMGESGYGIDVSTINFISKEIKSRFFGVIEKEINELRKNEMKYKLNKQKDSKLEHPPTYLHTIPDEYCFPIGRNWSFGFKIRNLK